MATMQELERALINAHNAGDSQAAQRLAQAIVAQREASKAPAVPSGYETQAKDDSFLQNLGASFGGAIAGIPLGVRQMLGKASQDEVNEWAKSMQGLWGTSGGKIGTIAGAAVPGALATGIPGVNTVAGSAIAGGALGLLSPVEEDQTRAGNVVKGAILNAALPAAVAGFKTVKGVVAPFTQSGREGIAGRALERFATDPANIQKAADVTWVSGAKPTLAEAAGDVGLANLQRTVQTMDPRGAISQRFADNNAARIAALTEIAGDPAKRAAAEAARDAAAAPLYKAADAGMAALDDGFASLLQRPAFAKAVQQADDLAKNEGLPGVFLRGADGKPTALTGRGAHFVKKALDDMADKSSQSYMGGASAKSAGKTQEAFLGWLNKFIPEYDAARATFQQASRPLNQMDIGQRLLDTKMSALRDITGNPKVYGEQFAKALRNEDALVKQATGMRSRGLLDVMEPQQMKVLTGIVDELSANSASQSAGKVAGSPTAQYMVGQDIMARIAGPLGVPQEAAGSVLARTAFSRPASFLLKTPEEEVVGLLADAMLDPKLAAGLLKKGQPTKLARESQLLLDRILPSINSSVTGVGLLPAQ